MDLINNVVLAHAITALIILTEAVKSAC